MAGDKDIWTTLLCLLLRRRLKMVDWMGRKDKKNKTQVVGIWSFCIFAGCRETSSCAAYAPCNSGHKYTFDCAVDLCTLAKFTHNLIQWLHGLAYRNGPLVFLFPCYEPD